MITVRRGSLDDFPVMLDMGRAMQAESLIPYPSIDEAVYRATVTVLGERYFIALAEREGEAVGMLTAFRTPFTFSAVEFAKHDIFYVRPSVRGSKAALKLVRAFEAWRAECGLDKAVLSVDTGLRPGVTGRFYERLGYRLMGGQYMKEFG
jgi:GNAT superfamily N-acetyltransferase